MNTAKHTPGPWAVSPADGSLTPDKNACSIYKRGGTARIATIHCPVENSENANARLIAAAPELYDIVLGLMEYHGPGTCPDHLFEAGNNILRRIEGEE